MFLGLTPARPTARPLALLVGLLFCAACSSLPAPPPEQVRAKHGVVFAEDTSIAADVARDFDAAWEAMHDLLPGCRDADVTVWVQRRLHRSPHDDPPSFLVAFSVPEVDLAVVRENDDERLHSLNHELFHVLHDETWGALPTFLEEGVADVVAQRLAPGVRSDMEGMLGLLPCLPGVQAELVVQSGGAADPLHVSQGLALGGARLDAAEIAAILEHDEPSSALTGSEDFSSGYALGFVVARRALDRGGLQGLRDLCASARARDLDRVPGEELLAAADLPPDPQDWWPLLAPALGAEDVQAAAGFWAGSLADALRALLPGPGVAAARVAAREVELRIGSARTNLADVPAVVFALR